MIHSLKIVTFSCILTLLVGSGTFAQETQLYRSGTLLDGIENPHEHVFRDDKKGFGFTFSPMDLNFSMTTMGPKSVRMTNFLFGDDIDYDLSSYPISDKMNYMNFKFRTDILAMRFRVQKKTNMEFTYAIQLFNDNQLSVSYNFVNLALMGNAPYVNQTMNAFANGFNYTNTYARFTYGLRRSFLEGNKLSVCVNYHRYYGLLFLGNEIDNSNFITYPVDSTHAYFHGTFYTIANYQDSIYQKVINKPYYYHGEVNNHDTTNQMSDGLTTVATQTVKTILLTNIGKSGGRGFSIGASYNINDKLSVSGAIKDVGKITWSEKSVRYVYEMDSTYIGLVNIIYDTSASFEPLVNVKNFPTAGNPAKWRWIDSFLMSYVIDTIQGEFKTNLPTAYELGVGYIWLPWYSTYLHI